jgi:hypothetical protein
MKVCVIAARAEPTFDVVHQVLQQHQQRRSGSVVQLDRFRSQAGKI